MQCLDFGPKTRSATTAYGVCVCVCVCVWHALTMGIGRYGARYSGGPGPRDGNEGFIHTQDQRATDLMWNKNENMKSTWQV